MKETSVSYDFCLARAADENSWQSEVECDVTFKPYGLLVVNKGSETPITHRCIGRFHERMISIDRRDAFHLAVYAYDNIEHNRPLRMLGSWLPADSRVARAATTCARAVHSCSLTGGGAEGSGAAGFALTAGLNGVVVSTFGPGALVMRIASRGGDAADALPGAGG